MEPKLASELCSQVSHRIEKAVDKLDDYHIKSEARFARIETTLEAIAENLKQTSDQIKDIKSDNTSTLSDLMKLKTEMTLIKWIGGAVGLGVLGLLFEMAQRVLI